MRVADSRDTPPGVERLRAYGNIGQIYLRMRDTPKAVTYLSKAREQAAEKLSRLIDANFRETTDGTMSVTFSGAMFSAARNASLGRRKSRGFHCSTNLSR